MRIVIFISSSSSSSSSPFGHLLFANGKTVLQTLEEPCENRERLSSWLLLLLLVEIKAQKTHNP
jgi:hypothetical protein